MHQNIYSDLKNRIMRNKRHTVLKRIVSVLSITVMFCTTYALILPAITMEQKTFCGVEEHTHSKACYSQIQQTELVCTAQHLNIHTHAEGCYGPEGNLICGQCDYVAHTHDGRCHNAAGELVCTLAERGVHVHGDGCYVPGETLPEVLHVHSDACNVLQRGEQICIQEELEGHAHGDACYEPSDVLLCTKQENHVHVESCYEIPLVCTQSTEPHVHGTDCNGRGGLICNTTENHVHGDGCRETMVVCGNTEEGHSHGDGCYSSNIICSIPENHSHGDSCYESIIVCGKAEGECHSHESGCYGEQKLICTEDENHVHSGSCYEPHLICTMDEIPGHAHGDECYEQVTVIGCGLNEGEAEPTEPVEPVLVCTEPAAQVHVHGDTCFETVTTQAAPICGNEAADHEHTTECYVIQCGLEEHTHDTACYSDPEADLETAATWESTFTHVELTGNWQEDVLSIAKTQLGYTESANNYSVWADGTTHGYTRYGQWYGSPYGDWCAMFVSFCLNYAEVEGMPLHWGVRPWIEELTKLKLYHEAEVYTPEPGDLIFYDWEGDDLSDHVGFVAEIIPETDYEPAQVKALEGNSSNCVQYVYYEYDDSRILGYSELPDNIEIYSCGILRHIHNEYCHDAAGNRTCLQVEHLHTELCEPRDTLYCGLEIHNHSESCFDEAGELICKITEHAHNEDCYVQAPAGEEEKAFYCSQQEHTHAETCYDEAGELVCEIPEHTHTEECTAEPIVPTYYCELEEHIHAETCYDEAGELVCDIPEHTHTEECSAEPVVYYCGQEEHTHVETCYDEAGELICEIPEHTHTEECTAEPVTYYCGLEEHTHVETCYDEAGELVCEIPEHTHTEECTAEPVVYYCGQEEHTHAETCYDEAGELICEIPEHTHTEECTAEPVVYYCFKQEHTHTDVCYDESGNLLCQVPEHTHTEECTKIPVYLCGMEEHTHAEECYDEAGNLICQTHEHIHSEQCVIVGGYICGLEEHTHNENCYDAEGNFICTLEEHTHTDACKAQNAYACGLEEHTHSEACYDEEGNLICEIPEHVHSAACVGRNLYYSDMQIRVHAVIRGVENLPAKLTLKVHKVVPEQDPKSFGDMQVAVNEQISTQEQYLSQASFYEMYLLSEDEIYNLPETADVTVTMEFEEPIFTPDAMEDAIGTHSFMLTPEGGMQLPPDMTEGEQQPVDEEDITEPDEDPSLMESVISNITSGLQSMLTPALALDDLDQIDDIPAGEEEIPADSELPEEPGTVYDVSGLNSEDYGNAQQGITSVTFTTNRISTFAVALASTVQEGTYWERVDSMDDIESGGTYMIVSAEGSYALTGNNSTNYQGIVYQMVKGNSGYYTITNSDNNNLRWTITRSGNNYTVRNQGTSNYIYLGSDIISSNSRNMVITISPDAAGCVRIQRYESNYYLQNTGSNSFSRSNSNDGTFDSYGKNITMNNTKDMLLFKLSDTTSLEIPSDVTANTSDNDNGSTDSGPSKPDYGNFIVPADSKTGDTAVTDETDSTIRVSGKYYSDPATSDLETNFRTDTYAQNELNDGKVMTDKSVIYGDDDYDAFSSYAPNTFGVTLSALGQEYEVPYNYNVRTPIDVVYILDVSGSMSDSFTQDDVTTTRAQALTTAVNTSMKQILDDHAENRVGMVLYSSGAWEMLPLDRYTATNGQYLTCSQQSVTTSNGYSPNSSSGGVWVVKGSSSLKNDSGISYAGAGGSVSQGVGTYTQAGIALGRKVFGDIGNDTTYTTTLGEGEQQREVTVIRQPIFILVSDGEPTHSTNNYADVLNGPHYGNGTSSPGNNGDGNGKGIHGYNTVLSANYYKRMVGIQYQKPALFFTIGMGISANDDGPLVTSSGTGDNYKRAVLNPTSSTISQTSKSATYTIDMMESMINGTYNNQSVATNAKWPDSWWGVPHEDIPVVKPNPYAGNYSYTDHAYFGQLSSSDLENIFSDILTSSTVDTPYGFILFRNSSVEMTDVIGQGMEIKGTPVLRYNGINYSNPTITTSGNVTTYTYSATYKDPYIPDRTIELSQIIVTVTTDAAGQQTVDLKVPDTALPTYTPNLIGATATGENVCGLDEHTHIPRGQSNSCYNYYGRLTCNKQEHTHSASCKYNDSMFYYESLPVRLIYQVGLTEESEAAVLALNQTGGQLTFYTNAFTGTGSNIVPESMAELDPSLQNPFYHNQYNEDGTLKSQAQYHAHHDDKDDNTTGTASYHVDCSMEIFQVEVDGKTETAIEVIHELGNNGKLVFEAENVAIPVEKKWGDGIAASGQNDVTAVLYRVVETSADGTNVSRTGTKVAEITLGNSNNWTGSFTGLPTPNDDFYYAIAEIVPQGAQVRYTGGEILEISVDSMPIQAVKVDSSFFASEDPSVITITNLPGIELPKTGGPGTFLYTAGGLLLMAAAIFLLFYNRKSQISRP